MSEVKKMAGSDEKARTALYVGDLHPDVTEKDLIEIFSRVVPLISVHLCRDKFSHDCKSLCYAYINFWLPCHAATAFECLNHYPLKGQAIRIMWRERDPSARKSNNGNLFVKNLDKSITSGRLQEVFSKYGTILSCKVSEENGISKGFGFVQFDSEDSAIAACSALHDSFLEGKKLYVSKLIKKNDRNGAEAGFRSLFVKYLDEDITADVLKAKFSEYGNVFSAVIVKDEKGKSKGFGFVNFDSHEAAKRAMEALNGELLGSKKIFVGRAVKKSEPRKNFRQMPGYTYPDCSKESKWLNMFVKNHHESVPAKKLEDPFSGYGTVYSGKPIWNDGVSRRFGYTYYSCPNNTKMALNSLTEANSKGKTLNVAVAKQKEQEAIKLHKPCVKSSPQPFYASNCQPPRCNFPYFQKPSPWQPTVYQYLAGSSNSPCSIIAQNIQRTFNHMGLAAPNGYKQARYLEMVKDLEMAKDQKPSSPVKLSHSGHVKELSKESRTTKTLRIRQGCTLQPQVKNPQLRSDSPRVQKSPDMAGSPHGDVVQIWRGRI